MEPRYNGGANGLANFLYIEDVFRIFYYYGGGEYRSYIEVCYVEIPMYFFSVRAAGVFKGERSLFRCARIRRARAEVAS